MPTRATRERKTAHTDAGWVSHFYFLDLEEEEQNRAWTAQRESRNAHLLRKNVHVSDFIYKSGFGKYCDNGAMKGQDVSVPWQMIRKPPPPVSPISEGKQSRPAISVTEPRPPRAHAHPGPSRRVHGQPQDQPGSRLIQERSNRWQKAAANPSKRSVLTMQQG